MRFFVAAVPPGQHARDVSGEADQVLLATAQLQGKARELQGEVSGHLNLGTVGDPEALRLGAADYLIKPLEDLAVLEHSVRRALDRARLLVENQRYREKLETANRELEASLHLDALRNGRAAGCGDRRRRACDGRSAPRWLDATRLP